MNFTKDVAVWRLFRPHVEIVIPPWLLRHLAANWGLLKKPDRLRHSLFQRSRADKLASIRAIHNCYNCRKPQMYRKHHNGQLSIEEFHVPFGGTLYPANRWVLFSSLMPWEELEATYAPRWRPLQWCNSPGTPTPA